MRKSTTASPLSSPKFDAWDMRIRTFEAVRMLGRELPARPGRHADDEAGTPN